MAYKFQLGNARLGGQVSANGLDAQDANVTNVGEIAVDKIEADGNRLDIDVANSQANAVVISGSASGEMMRFDSTGASTIHVGTDMEFATNSEINLRQGTNKIMSPAANEIVVEASASLNLSIDGNAVLSLDEFGIIAKQDLQMSGSAKLSYPDSASGKLLIGDGNGYSPQAVSGDATLAANGALTIANDAVDNNMLANIARGSVKVGGASNAPTDLDAKTSGQILVGDGTDIVSVAVSGDATLAANGALTIANTAIESGMLNNNVISGQTALGSAAAAQADELLFSDAGTLKKITFSNLEDSIFGNLSGDATVAAGGAVTLAGAQTNVTSLKNASLVVGAASGNDHISFATAGSILLQTNNVSRITVTDSATTISGDLIVNGTTTTVNSTSIEITGSFVFEGSSPDANETTLNVIDPTADRTISLADSAGTLVPFAATPAAGVTISATPGELNLLDGSTAVGSSITLADGDGFIVHDSGTMKTIPASDLKTYIGNSSLLDVALKADGDTLAVGFNYMADMGSDGTDTLTLPASPSVGDVVRVKAPSDASSARIARISRAGSHLIDGEQSIDLVSPFAAVNLIYVDTNLWRVF